MTHGDLSTRQCPQPGSVITVTAQSVAVFDAALQLYETALASQIELSLESLQMRLTPPVGAVVFSLLDACHDLLEH